MDICGLLSSGATSCSIGTIISSVCSCTTSSIDCIEALVDCLTGKIAEHQKMYLLLELGSSYLNVSTYSEMEKGVH